MQGTSLIKKRLPLGPYGRTYPEPYGGHRGGTFSYERGTPVVFRALGVLSKTLPADIFLLKHVF